jgi:hypothetical protein
MSMHEQVIEQIQRVVSEFQIEDVVSPVAVAVAVHDYFRDGDDVEQHVAYASIEHLKQLARHYLARQYSPAERAQEMAIGQGDMFSDLLQDRYPLPHGGREEPEGYKLRDRMTLGELDWNIAQIRKCGESLLRHARALKAYRDGREGAAPSTMAA